jgi:serine/threonine protein kinase
MSPVAECNLKEFFALLEGSPELDYTIRLKEWFGCLATAVQYLHGIQIRHRDIKPANILIHGANILLVDFELALDWKDLSHSTTSSDCGCTTMYAAPEVILYNKRNSTSDIWSLGCVFLEMATVLKGKRISDMRTHFTSQADNACFFNNEAGISQWILILKNISDSHNAPLFWVSEMLQHDRLLRPKAAAVTQLVRSTPRDRCQPSLYIGECCKDACFESTTVRPVQGSIDVRVQCNNERRKQSASDGNLAEHVNPRHCSVCSAKVREYDSSDDIMMLTFVESSRGGYPTPSKSSIRWLQLGYSGSYLQAPRMDGRQVGCTTPSFSIPSSIYG